MATINKNFDKLAASYLFSEIAKRTKAFVDENHGVEIMRLGIGNTTEPLVPAVVQGLHTGVEKLSKVETYTGYGDEQGDFRLRKAIANWYKTRGVILEPTEVFISDGGKPDTANIQSIFGQKNIVAVQDPVYPVYVDSNVIAGRSGKQTQGKYTGIYYMPCVEEHNFSPKVPDVKVDLIYLCSPNNPTGTAMTKKDLKAFVNYAKKHKAIIIFDAAYAFYIQDESLPKSIYEIEGAADCAIEINSFSKFAGFTGVRLGWTIVPKKASCEDVKPEKLNQLWLRRQTTMFNGASNVVQEGGIAALSPKGLRECQKIVQYYMQNAKIIKQGIEKLGIQTFGGENAPYIWMKTPERMNSWMFFDKLLHQTHVVGTPGSGFGPSGEGYFRLSAFGHRENIQKAMKSIRENLTV